MAAATEKIAIDAVHIQQMEWCKSMNTPLLEETNKHTSGPTRPRIDELLIQLTREISEIKTKLEQPKQDARSSIDPMEILIDALVNRIFSDRTKLRQIALQSIKPLSIDDVAYLLGKAPRTVRRMQERGDIRMNAGPDGELMMHPRDFENWYYSTYKKPRPSH